MDPLILQFFVKFTLYQGCLKKPVGSEIATFIVATENLYNLLHRQVNIKNVMPDSIRHPAKFIMDSVFRRNDRNEAIKLPK